MNWGLLFKPYSEEDRSTIMRGVLLLSWLNIYYMLTSRAGEHLSVGVRFGKFEVEIKLGVWA